MNGEWLAEVLRKAEVEQADILREGVRGLTEELMKIELAEHIGAERHERTVERIGLPQRLSRAAVGYAPRKRLQVQYRALYDEVVDILFEVDPIGVHVHHNAEQFVPEATTILARLREARFAEDVENIVQQELRRWYGRRRLARQNPPRLARATIATCSAWNRFLAESARV